MLHFSQVRLLGNGGAFVLLGLEDKARLLGTFLWKWGDSKPFLFNCWSLREKQFSPLHVLTTTCKLPTSPEAKGLLDREQKALLTWDQTNPSFFYVDLISRILTQWRKVDWRMNISSCPPWPVSYWFQTMEAEAGSIPEYYYPLTAFTGQRDSWELSIKHLKPAIISLRKANYPSDIFQKDQSLHT